MVIGCLKSYVGCKEAPRSDYVEGPTFVFILVADEEPDVCNEMVQLVPNNTHRDIRTLLYNICRL